MAQQSPVNEKEWVCPNCKLTTFSADVYAVCPQCGCAMISNTVRPDEPGPDFIRYQSLKEL